MTRVQILDVAVCISLCTNTIEKGMNPTILFPVIGKLNHLAFIWQPVKEKEN